MLSDLHKMSYLITNDSVLEGALKTTAEIETSMGAKGLIDLFITNIGM